MWNARFWNARFWNARFWGALGVRGKGRATVRFVDQRQIELLWAELRVPDPVITATGLEALPEKTVPKVAPPQRVGVPSVRPAQDVPVPITALVKRRAELTQDRERLQTQLTEVDSQIREIDSVVKKEERVSVPKGQWDDGLELVPWEDFVSPWENFLDGNGISVKGDKWGDFLALNGISKERS